MFSFWARVPVVIRAILTGLVAATVVTAPWAILVRANLKYWSAVPWAVPPTLLYLWLWWVYVGGTGWPRSTALLRRINLRASRVSEEVWGASLVAGILGIATALLVLRITNRLVSIPQQALPDISRIPLVTVLGLHLMGSAVAGIVEEASFRGYMQGPIERRHGPAAAILITGTVFGLAHFTHPGMLVMMPFYLTIAATYGVLAYLTNSIFPGLVLHASGDALGGIAALAGGRQTSSVPLPPIRELGSDASFWLSCVAVVAVGAATIWAYAALASVVRDQGRVSA